MLFDIFLFLISSATVLFSFTGYILSLALIRTFRERNLDVKIMELASSNTEDLPAIYFLVAVYNEANYIENKLTNISQLQYPSTKKHVYIIDGNSTDTTRQLVQKYKTANTQLNLQLMISEYPNKIAQINLALAQISDPQAIVVITDADALIQTPNAIQKTIAPFLNDSSIGLVGGWTNPDTTQAKQADLAYWDKQNRARYLETITYSASIVVAPYYAFRRHLLSRFPEDCVADDVYISYAAHLQKKRILYLPEIFITEIRSPQTITAMFRHKLRKAHAYTIELFRVAYRLPYMSKRLKYFYLTKLLQFFYLPWAFLFLFIESIILTGSHHYYLVLGFYSIFLFLILLTSYALKPPPGLSRGGITFSSFCASVEIFVLMNCVLFLNSFLFPFWQQNASYRKVNT